jgi:ABC-type amino acid transport system permease subunit
LLKWGVEKGDGKSEQGVPYNSRLFFWAYWTIFFGFFAFLLYFVFPTFSKPYTIMVLLLCAVIIVSPTDYRYAVLTFLAGTALGYFLEVWGTTRQCWTYYTFQTPPLFAVLAHGMAAVAFWRAGLLVRFIWGKMLARLRSWMKIVKDLQA